VVTNAGFVSIGNASTLVFVKNVKAGWLIAGFLCACSSGGDSPSFDTFNKLGETPFTPVANVDNLGIAGLIVKGDVLLVGSRTGVVISYPLAAGAVKGLAGAPLGSVVAVPGGNGVGAMALQGNRLYFTSEGRFATLDVTDPHMPKTLGTVGPVLPAHIVAASDKLVALTSGPGQVQLVDVAVDPPVVHPPGPLSPGPVTGLVLSGNTLYLTEMLTSSIRSFDVTDSAAPKPLGMITVKDPSIRSGRFPNPGGLLLKGKTLYAFGMNTMYVIDVSDPTQLKQLNTDVGMGFYNETSIYTREWMQAAFVSDSVIALPGSVPADQGSFSIHLMDVSNPSAPKLLPASSAGSLAGVPYLAASGAFVFSSDGSTIKISGPR
jgi:hypothetical protein